jgi:hypothetical protein
VAFTHFHFLMYPLKKGDADLLRKYDELPPEDLMKILQLERAAINRDELSRAEWFWNRRPELMIENRPFLCCYILGFFCLLYLASTAVPTCLVWMVAGMSCAVVDYIRFVRWRNEYKSSIKRVFINL